MTSKYLFRWKFQINLIINLYFQSGVPRTGYRGVVTFMHKGRRVYLAPSADWKGNYLFDSYNNLFFIILYN